MGMDLRGAGGDFHLTGFCWSSALELAHAYGWEPAGTEMGKCGYPDCPGCPADDCPAVEPHPPWQGGYGTNDYQTVTAEDAGGIATALEKALPDIPNHDAVDHKRVPLPNGWRGVPADVKVSPLECFSGPYKQVIKDFITFCRAGEFQIG